MKMKPKGQKISIAFSTYPITRGILSTLEKSANISIGKTVLLGELKKQSVQGIYIALRRLSCDTLWIIVNEHNYQPMLPILLILSSLTRAEIIRVVDFKGCHYPISRFRIFVTEPPRLLLATIKGLLIILLTSVKCKNLLKTNRITIAQIPSQPRIAYLKTNLLFGVQAGGSIGHVAGVVNGFSRMGCSVDVFTVEKIPMVDASINIVDISGSDVAGLPLETSTYLFQGSYVSQVSQRMMHKHDIIYQRNCLANLAGVTLSRRLSIPLVIEYNGSEVWVSDKWGTPLKFPSVAKDIETVNLKHAHLIVVVSDVLKDELISRGIHPGRILSYPNCIDAHIFNPDRYTTKDSENLRAQYGIRQDAVLCTFVGTFGPWHGVDVLANAIDRLANDHAEWMTEHNLHFMLVGDGQLMPQVRNVLERSASRFVTMTGLVAQDETASHLAASDILLSPHIGNADGTRFFGSPTKLFEYMAMGKGIVASDLDQIGDVLSKSVRIDELPHDLPQDEEQRMAVLSPPGDPNGLMKGILFLVENRSWRILMGKNARREALSKYTWEIHVAKIMDALKNIMHE